MDESKDTANSEYHDEMKCCGSSRCGASRCCGTKALMVVVLVLLGGIIGYLSGSHHGNYYDNRCPVPMMQTPGHDR